MIFPASPGTQIISIKRGDTLATLMPVVGWYHVQGTLAFPICAMPHGGITRGKAVITPDGLVTDPSFGIVCTDKEEWLNLVATKNYWDSKGVPGYEATLEAQNLKPKRDKGSHVSGDPVDDLDDDGETTAPVQTKRIPDKPQRQRAPRVFKTNSWWKTRSEATKAIMQIDGGATVPYEDDLTWEKIGIVDFKALKKQGWTVTDDGGVPAATEDDDDLI
jgi:hypothetical protein